MWLSPEYVYRRVVTIQAPMQEAVPASHPVSVEIPRSIILNGKMREDLEDLEVVYLDDDGEEVVLYRDVEETEDFFLVSFSLHGDIPSAEAITDRYFIYYGNPSLQDQVDRPSGDVDDWPVEIGYDHPLVSYTRPGEHWKDGVSTQRLARLSVTIESDRIRVFSEVGPDKAIMEVQIDDGLWRPVDLRASIEEILPVYEVVDLEKKSHELRIRVTGETSSYGDEVNVKYIQYRKPVLTSDLGEEIYDFVWSSSVGGV